MAKRKIDELYKLRLTEIRDADVLNQIYKTLRYFIPCDGTVRHYVDKYNDPWIRVDRVLFLEEEITTHTASLQAHIDDVLNKRVD